MGKSNKISGGSRSNDGEGGVIGYTEEGSEGGRVKCHSLVAGVWCPVHTMVSFTMTVTSVDVNATLHPALHNCPIEMRDKEVRAGAI